MCVSCFGLVVSTCQVIGKRKTPLMTPSWGEEIISTNPRWKTECIFFLFVYVAVCFPAATQYIFHTPMARYSLFVLKVPLNTNKTNIQVMPISHFHTVLKLTSNCYHFAFEQNVYRVLKFLENIARLTISKIIKNSCCCCCCWGSVLPI